MSNHAASCIDVTDLYSDILEATRLSSFLLTTLET